MPRKIVIRTPDGLFPVLDESLADDEAQLQELVKSQPDLLPVEEFGMSTPLLVVGRETAVASGAIDLTALTRRGDLLIVEFKTGPQNSDFRHALAQLLDYGAHLWEQTLSDFEAAVAVRYFRSDRCAPLLRGSTSLEAAARLVWPDLSDEEWQTALSKLEQQLSTGSFHYVLVAQRFTPTMERTMSYMNASMTAGRFYGIELVKFAARDLAAFESRTVVKPPQKETRATVLTNESAFLEQFGEDDYRTLIADFIEQCRFIGLRLEWGSAGVSIRSLSRFRRDPLSVAWIFPPGRSGWAGLRDLNLGVDPSSAKQLVGAEKTIDWYIETLTALPGVEAVTLANMRAVRVPPANLPSLKASLEDILAQLSRRLVDEDEDTDVRE